MKKGLVCALFMASCLMLGFAAHAKGFRDMSFNGSYVTRNPIYINVWEPFMKAAEAKFPGQDGLSFNYYSMDELYPESEALDALSDGRVDFGTFNPPKYPGKLNLIKVVEIPGIIPDPVVGSLVMQDIMEEFPEVRAELPPNSVALTSWVSAPFNIHTTKPIKSLEELKGQKLVVWNAHTKDLAEALGAVPVRVNPPDTYLALSKGMADGVLTAIAPIRSLKFGELVPHHLNLDAGMGTFILGVNQDVWNDMPEEMQNWLKEQLGSKSALAVGNALKTGDQIDSQAMKDAGQQFYDLSEADQAELKRILTVFADRWKNETCKDIDPAVVEKVYQFALERVKHHTEQQKAGAYDKPVTYTAQ